MRETRAITKVCVLGAVAAITAALGGCATNASQDTVYTPPPPPQSAAPNSTEVEGGSSDTRPSEAPSESAVEAPSTPTKPKEDISDEPIFVAAVPGTVKANPRQKIIVQLPTDPDTRWKANVNGTASVSSVNYEGPPAGQPDAPGTSIANVTAPPAGISYINFIRVPKGGGETIETARLEVVVS